MVDRTQGGLVYDGNFGMGPLPSTAADVTISAKFLAADLAGAGAYTKWGGLFSTAALGSVAVVAAAIHGNRKQVAAEFAGIIGSATYAAAGTTVGASFGSKVGRFFGPEGWW